MRFVLIPILFFFTVVSAQESNQYLLLPSFNINKGLENDWKVNVEIESRQQLRRISSIVDETYEYLLTDIAVAISKKVGLNNTVAGGYLVRISEDKPYHRAFQQFTIVKRFTGFRFAQRVATDQTFSVDDNPTFRLRYRAGFELPLNGTSVDQKEFYLKLNNEYLGIAEGEFDLEIRMAPFVGYIFNSEQRMELGLDYRIDSFINAQIRQRYFIAINWYMSL